MTDRVIIGSRSSKLALTQSNWVADKLRRFHPDLLVEIIEIKTTGDLKLGASLSEIGGKGAFTKELEDALLGKRCDLAVHSLKDLPTVLPDGLRIGCTPERERTDDALVFAEGIGTIDDEGDPFRFLPQDAVVGTSSLRRKAQLLHKRPDIQVVEWRGNVDSRLRKLEQGNAHAIILAAAGLNRLGLIDFTTRPDRVDSRLDSLPLMAPRWLPAVGQGVLGIEVREGDSRLLRLLAPLHDSATFAAATAERAFLNRLGAGCMAPVGAMATVPEGSVVKLTGRVLSKQGVTSIEHSAAGEIGKPAELGVQVAEWCLSHGADKLV